MTTAEPTVIVLAAGKGDRFRASGGAAHKLDALLDGKPVLRHVLDAVNASGLGHYLVRPEGGTAGMGDSIALGVRATADAAGWLILPGDLPLITPDSLRRVADALRHNALVVPHYQQQHGHPVGFGRQYLRALLALNGDSGARAIVRRARADGTVRSLPLTDVGIIQDIDSLADLQQAQQRLDEVIKRA